MKKHLVILVVVGFVLSANQADAWLWGKKKKKLAPPKKEEVAPQPEPEELPPTPPPPPVPIRIVATNGMDMALVYMDTGVVIMSTNHSIQEVVVRLASLVQESNNAFAAMRSQYENQLKYLVDAHKIKNQKIGITVQNLKRVLQLWKPSLPDPAVKAKKEEETNEETEQ